MSSLYSQLAQVYEAMYHTFMDYPSEYNFYSQIFQKYHKKNLLEIGSGTGNLAGIFHKNGYQYIGLDLSEAMIAIAQKKIRGVEFVQGDMRAFQLKTPVTGILMPGRTISYLKHNSEVKDTFTCAYKNLQSGGIFCFDFIDAERFLPEIIRNKNVNHEASYQGIDYLRKGEWTLDLKQGMTVNWVANYYKKVADEWVALGKDTSVLRTFLQEEIRLLLELSGFVVKEVLDKTSYAYPTYVMVAEKL